MKDPCHLSIYFHHQFISQLKISQMNITVSAHHFIMIAGNVDDPCAFAEQVHDLFDHLHV
jgi:threonine synthase